MESKQQSKIADEENAKGVNAVLGTLQALERQGMLAILEGLQHRDTCGGKESVLFKGTSKDAKKRARRRMQSKIEDILLTEAHKNDRRDITYVSTLMFGIAEFELTQAQLEKLESNNKEIDVVLSFLSEGGFDGSG